MNYERQLKQKAKIIESLTKENACLEEKVNALKIENKHLIDDNNKYKNQQSILEQTIAEYIAATSAARKIEADYKTAFEQTLIIKRDYIKEMKQLMSAINRK